jgi:hypothetical protein
MHGTGIAAPQGGRPLDGDTRTYFEARFGRGLGGVRVHDGAAADASARAVGAVAYTAGNDVVFRAGTYAPRSAPGRRLLAHELAHTLQPEHGGAGEAAVAPTGSAAETDAARAGDRAAAGLDAGAVGARPAGVIHRFAPGGHQQSTVDALSATFSGIEIGWIYAANWERDFSQGHPAIANAAIAWQAVKTHAAENGGEPGPAGDTFRLAIEALVDVDVSDITFGDSLGGAKSWEHMDQPTGDLLSLSSPIVDAAVRWQTKPGDVPGYILDSRAHIKDQLVAAIDFYRLSFGRGQVGDGFDNWRGGERPDDYIAPRVYAEDGMVRTAMPNGWFDTRVSSRNPIIEATQDMARARGAKKKPDYNAGTWMVVGQHLGRAMHAFQDFWSHSNWLELADAAINRNETVTNGQLVTGTFTNPAKAHALGHKLVALAGEFTKEFPLLLKIYGRGSASSALDTHAVRTSHSTIWGSAGTDQMKAYDFLRKDAWLPLTEMEHVGITLNNVEELVLSKAYGMDDFLCNPRWLKALARKGELLIEEGEKSAGPDSHGTIAKDQPEAGKDHAGALRLATAADEATFGPVRAIMEERNPAMAFWLTQQQLRLIDRMIQAPSPQHPLWSLAQEIVGGK